MVVHPDEPGDHTVSAHIEDLRARGNRCSGVAYVIDFSSHDDDRDVIARRCARSIDHTHVREREDRGIDANE